VTTGPAPAPRPGRLRAAARTGLHSGVQVVSDHVVLNTLWVVCSLGVVTAPAATTALLGVASEWAQGHDRDGSARLFLRIFRDRFRRSLALAGVWTALGAVITADALFVAAAGQPLRTVLGVPLLPVIALYALTAVTLFLVNATTEGTWVDVARATVLLSLRCLPAALASTALVVVFAMVVVSAPLALLLLTSTVAEGVAWLCRADRRSPAPARRA